MTEVKYMISDVSRILDIPTNVLRYLEYCLSLNIKRTELGYRYYLQEDIDLLGNVRILRDKGFHMKVIKSILPYIDKVKDLDASKLYELRERLEAALGLSGLEAKESLKAQYGKVIDINMEEGDFVYKDPTTQQKTRLSSVPIKTEEVNTQPIALEVDNRSCEEVAATDVVMRESHMDEETTNLSENYEFSSLENSINYKEKEFFTDRKSRKKKEKQVTQIYDVIQAKPCHYMGAKKMNNIVDVMKFEDQPEEKVDAEEEKLEEVEEKVEGEVEEKLDGKVEEKAEGAPIVKEEESLQAKLETKTESKTEEKREETRSEVKGLYATQDTMLKLNQDKIVQFREIMYSIVMDAVRQNNHTLTNDINDTVTQSIVKEMDYMMRVREERQEEKFRQLDRTIRETQLQRQQAAATKEGKKKKPSKFFQKNKVHI